MTKRTLSLSLLSLTLSLLLLSSCGEPGTNDVQINVNGDDAANAELTESTNHYTHSPDRHTPGNPETSPQPPADDALIQEPGYRVYIPPYSIPPEGQEPPEYEISIGRRQPADFFIYEGRFYFGAERYLPFNEENAEKYLGERIGYVSGGIAWWSGPEAYTELAGTITGDIYLANGYDENFRLCLITPQYIQFADDIRYPVDQMIVFFERWHDAGFTTGEDIFGERFHLRDRWRGVEYLTDDDWNYTYDYIGSIYHGHAFHSLDRVSDDAINMFIDTLYTGLLDFDLLDEHIEDGYVTFPPARRVHLSFTLDDGTAVKLLLFEDGVVQYKFPVTFDPIGRFLDTRTLYIKMPGEAFDIVWNACR